MYDTHAPAEWLATGSAAIGVYAACCVPYFLLVEAELKDFDPRPALSRAIESESFYPLLREWDNARHSVRCAAVRARHIPRDAAISTAALLALLLPTSPAGGTR
ncbi:MAG TPA: hypothetical protein VFF37_08385 [Streptomyces sp.]|nr:hypothetical protein [Planctomycetota bacterium]HZX38330.1 hypothetical protein [Streptomyces sp.]